MSDIPNIDSIINDLNDRGLLEKPFYLNDDEYSGPAAPAPTETRTRDYGAIGGGTVTQEQAAAIKPPAEPTMIGSGPGTGDTYSNPIINPPPPAVSKEDNYAAEQAAATPPPEYTVLRNLLRQFGLDNIYDTVSQFITGEMGEAEIALAMRKVPEYQERFRVIFDREEAGLPPISAFDVLEYEQGLAAAFSYYGYPQDPGENLQDVAADLLRNDVSPVEMQERLAAQAAFGRAVLDDPNQDQEVVRQILGNGGTLFDVANFALDPNKTIEQIERRLAAAEVANEASGAGYGRLNTDEAMELARAGVTGEEAQQRFGVLNQQSQIVDRLIGDTADPVSREQELAAVAGDVNAQAAIERSRQSRLAQFQVGGSFATDSEGFGGLR